MTTLSYIFLGLQALFALVMGALILAQQGKGAETGAALGAAASTTLNGASGGVNLLTRLTTAAAVGFFVCTLAVTYFAKNTRAMDPSLFVTQPAQAPATLEAPSGDAK